VHTPTKERDEKEPFVHHSYDAYKTSHSHMVEYRVGRGCHYSSATTSSPWGLVYFKVTPSLGTPPTLPITTLLSAEAKQSLKAR
jgi:hypothetical protein